MKDTFVFVEKRPLVSRAVGSSLPALGPRFDPAMVPYQLRLSRVSMGFEAASLMAAYRSRDPEVRAFVKDQNLVVYRIPGYSEEFVVGMTHRMALSPLRCFGLPCRGTARCP